MTVTYERKCKVCGAPLGRFARYDKKTCSTKCRVRLHRDRKEQAELRKPPSCS